MYTQTKLGTNEFRIVSYNLLADLYADSDYSREHLFAQCPPHALDMSYRKCLIIKELLGYNSDLICLQEVDRGIFEWDLYPILRQNGYDGIYDRKGDVSEGSACFWNMDKFEHVSRHRMVLRDAILSDSKFEDILSVIQTNEKVLEGVTKRSTTLQTVVLKSKDDPKKGMSIT